MSTHIKHRKIHIYCDGGARGNPGPAAIGFVVNTPNGKFLHRHAETVGETTNNIAEYKAVVAALKWLQNYVEKTNRRLKSIQFFLDSRLVVNQLNGSFKVKDLKLKALVIQIHGLEKAVGVSLGRSDDPFSPNDPFLRYSLIPREQNSQADALVNEALDNH